MAMTSDPSTTVSVEVAEVDSRSLPKNASSSTPTLHPPSHASLRSGFSQPQKRDMDELTNAELGHLPSSSSLGQFSFAPATRTTVVTTTTTTTTSFPPLLIKPPRAIKDLDPKLYPLAASPTPASLRNFKFELGGKSVVFDELEDTASALKEVCLTPADDLSAYLLL